MSKPLKIEFYKKGGEKTSFRFIKKKKINSVKLIKRLKTRAWKLVSEYVRRKNASKITGMTKCFTCFAVKNWQEMDCGHRYHGTLDYDIRNLAVQCTKCNRFLHGNLGEYERNLIFEYGIKWADQLRIDAAQNRGLKYTITELNEIIADLEMKLKELEK